MLQRLVMIRGEIGNSAIAKRLPAATFRALHPMKIHRLVPLLILCCIGIAFTAVHTAHAQAGAEAWIVVDDQTGHILDSGSPNRKLQIASLTKIATAMVVLDWADLRKQDLNTVAVVPPAALQQGVTSPIGLVPGDEVSLRDLIYASLLQSDNIAAFTLAAHVGRALSEVTPPQVRSLGPVGVFVAQMNALATSLRMEKTLFLNPHGLDSGSSAPPHSTAADLARLTRHAMSKSAFRFYVSQREREIAINRGGQSLRYACRNTNTLLGSNSIDGVKTGRTRLAGDCLVLSAARAPETRKEGETVYVTPRRIHVVVLGATDRFAVGAGLLQRGWQIYDQWAAQGRPVTKKSTL